MFQFEMYDGQNHILHKYLATSFEAHKKENNGEFYIVFGNKKYVSKDFVIVDENGRRIHLNYKEKAFLLIEDTKKYSCVGTHFVRGKEK